MIYGHEFERGWSTRDLVAGVAIAAAMGVALGVLIAPAPGADMRRFLGDALQRWRERLDQAAATASSTVQQNDRDDGSAMLE